MQMMSHWFGENDNSFYLKCKLLSYYQYFVIASCRKKSNIQPQNIKTKKTASIISVYRECLTLSPGLSTTNLLSITKDKQDLKN